MKVIGSLASVLLLVIAGRAQNTCAYTFTYPKAQFSFCLTVWGTLASIQSPIGVNHLNAQNPVEGWTSFVVDDSGGNDGGPLIPGLGAACCVPPQVRQPNGPGTLPLIFDYDPDRTEGYREVVSAAPENRTISLTLIIRSCRNCVWGGYVSRVANVEADGSSTGTFTHSSFAAFGYVKHGLMLSVENSDCAGTDPNGASTTPHADCAGSDTPFTGTGAVFTSQDVFSFRGSPARVTAIYRVF